MKGGRYLEERHVKKVYDTIAPSFNEIPQKVWPNVKKFIKSLSPGALVADIGCGNGRYLHINKAVHKFGVDVCYPLVKLSQEKGYEVLVADNQRLPFKDDAFDAVISIGVLHHFSTEERRVKALSELCRVLRPGGKLLVYVWAYEQKHRRFDGQDVLVPWHPGKKRKHKGRFNSDQDVSSTSSVSEDDSIDMNSCDHGDPTRHFIQRTVSDPACPFCPQPCIINKQLDIRLNSLRQRSNTLPSSLDSYNGSYHGNSQIDEECRKLQITLGEMAASHLNVSTDSVFCSDTKVDSEEEGIVFETKLSTSGDIQNLKQDHSGDFQCKYDTGSCVDDSTKINEQLSLVRTKDCPETSYEAIDDNASLCLEKDEKIRNPEQKGKKTKKLSFLESLKKSFLKLIDSKTNDHEQINKHKNVMASQNQRSLDQSQRFLADNKSKFDEEFTNFAVREFPMSSCPDYRQKVNFDQCANKNQNGFNDYQKSIHHGLHQADNDPTEIPMFTHQKDNLNTEKIQEKLISKNSRIFGNKMNVKIDSTDSCTKFTKNFTPLEEHSPNDTTTFSNLVNGNSRPNKKSQQMNWNEEYTDGTKNSSEYHKDISNGLLYQESSHYVLLDDPGKKVFQNGHSGHGITDVNKDSHFDCCTNINHIKKLNCSQNKSSSHNSLSIQDSFKSCENLSTQNGADIVPSAMTIEEFQMARLCRYYHVFREGELSNLIFKNVNNLCIESCTYDHGNWCLIAVKVATLV